MNNKTKSILCGIGLIFSVSSFAQIETIGTTYEIQEVSLLEKIMTTLKEKESNGEVAKLQKQMTDASIANVERPKGAFFPAANENNIRYFDPTVQLSQDITLEDGTLIHPKGRKINPLTIRPLSKRLIFIDGDDKEQVEYAVKAHIKSGYRDKIILTKGSFGDLTREYKIRFYFDQQAKTGQRGRVTLAEEFGVKTVPTLVYQESPKKHYLTIEEVKL